MLCFTTELGRAMSWNAQASPSASFPGSWRKSAIWGTGLLTITLRDHYAASLRRPEFASVDGWDYGEYALKLPCLPATHKGTSGSAVWRVELGLDGEGRKEVFLDGVVLAEGPADDRKFIAHGVLSVSRILGET